MSGNTGQAPQAHRAGCLQDDTREQQARQHATGLRDFSLKGNHLREFLCSISAAPKVGRLFMVSEFPAVSQRPKHLLRVPHCLQWEPLGGGGLSV